MKFTLYESGAVYITLFISPLRAKNRNITVSERGFAPFSKWQNVNLSASQGIFLPLGDACTPVDFATGKFFAQFHGNA